jgi:hypothetical protein
VQGYVKSGKARLVKGNALVKDDVKRAWEESGRDRSVDTVVFSIGKTTNALLIKRQPLLTLIKAPAAANFTLQRAS